MGGERYPSCFYISCHKQTIYGKIESGQGKASRLCRTGGLSNTPYDDVFRTLLNDCSSLIIPVINEVFDECFSGDMSGKE